MIAGTYTALLSRDRGSVLELGADRRGVARGGSAAAPLPASSAGAVGPGLDRAFYLLLSWVAVIAIRPLVRLCCRRRR